MLSQKLYEYAKSDMYPFHMPGHKRVSLEQWSPYEMDITEIDGFDNLHQPREILLEEQKKAAKIYGSKECFYLINGSTCGILAAISSTVKIGGKILVARNCHKSVYNAIFLRQLEVVYAYPEVTAMGLSGQIKAETIEELLMKNPDVEAVLITSPTYDGMISDIESISKIVHKYEIPLIVDGAHGAHLGFIKEFPENPIKMGADIVIESVHKTLPAFTQTALLHVCSNRVPAKEVKKYLGIYESSSPSYILMAGIGRCMDYLEERGIEDLQRLAENLDNFYKQTQNLKNIKVLKKEDFTKIDLYDFDKSKILIFSTKQGVSGSRLYQILLEKYHLQMEMVSGQYVIALCSVMDTTEGLQRLAHALEEMDHSNIFQDTNDVTLEKTNIYCKKKQFLPIYKAEEMKKTEIRFEEAVGKISGEYLYLYPPGIPFLVPGEEITKNLIGDIITCQEKGLVIEGLPDKNRICIVNF